MSNPYKINEVARVDKVILNSKQIIFKNDINHQGFQINYYSESQRVHKLTNIKNDILEVYLGEHNQKDYILSIGLSNNLLQIGNQYFGQKLSKVLLQQSKFKFGYKLVNGETRNQLVPLKCQLGFESSYFHLSTYEENPKNNL